MCWLAIKTYLKMSLLICISDTNPFTLSILYKCNSYLDRKIREAMFIKQLKPKLNKNIGLHLTS